MKQQQTEERIKSMKNRTIKRTKKTVVNVLFICLPALLVLVCVAPVSATVITWAGISNTDWTNNGSWEGGVRPQDSATTDIARFAGNGTGANNPLDNFNWKVNGIQFEGVNWTIRTTSDGITRTLGIGSSGLAVNAATSGAVTINPNLYLWANQNWAVSTGSTLNVNGNVGGASSALTKTGAGRLIIAANTTNSYGNTVVSSGTLLVNGLLDVRAATVSVSADAVLGGTGTISRNTTIANGGIVAAGNNGAGTLNISSLTLGSTSVLEFELDSLVGNNDRIVTGDLVLDGLLNVTNLGGLQAGTYTLFTSSGTLTDNGLQLNNMPAGFAGSTISVDGGNVNLNVIPEPTTLTLFIISSVGMVALRRYHRD